MRKVIIVGGIPKPIGGVTSYIYRLASLFPFLFEEIWDIYPSSDKSTIKDVKISFFKRLYDIKLLFRLIKLNNIIFHFNFSTQYSLVRFIFLFKRKNVNWVLTLHNGNLSTKYHNLKVVCYFYRWILTRFDSVMVLSELQKDFYLACGVPVSKLHMINSFVPPSVSMSNSLNELPNNFKKFMQQNSGRKLLMMNGYCKPFYRFEDGVDFTIENEMTCLVVVLYGSTDKQYLLSLKNKAQASTRVLFMEGVEHDTFLSMLSLVDMYLRPNTVDSFGIAVADAICLGKLAIASDICQRFEGAITFKTGDTMAMKQLLTHSLHTQLTSHDKFQRSKYCKELLSRYELLYKK
ncbi:glycosyltransferase [Pseudoalteromonas undina]|uniref:glycosyltransferase n=1 Tax=Pseudoalteromonas undina TaxID=43660 RepID=UPI001866C995|nr:glycosyltransferase [Pseudoalteromonas undina]